MSRVAALALPVHPFALAIRSARASLHGLLEFMYGNEQRSRMTCWFALGLFTVGIAMARHTQAMSVCPIS
jgi:hypothetical protein